VREGGGRVFKKGRTEENKKGSQLFCADFQHWKKRRPGVPYSWLKIQGPVVLKKAVNLNILRGWGGCQELNEKKNMSTVLGGACPG